MGRGGAAALAAALVWAPSASALAQTAAAPAPPPIAVAAPDAPRSASLSWVRYDGATSCATATEIAEGVARILKRDALVAPTRAVMAIEARVERIPGKQRFRAIIDISGGDGKVRGTRKLESAGSDCRKLDDPAALAIALMIDPDALQPPPPASPTPPVPTVIVKRDVMIVPVPVFIEPPRTPGPPVLPGPPPRSSPELTLAIGPSLALGIVPGPAAGLRFGVEFGPPAALGEGDAITVGPSSIRAAFAVYSGSIEIEDEADRQTASLGMVAMLPQVAACPTTIWIGARVAFAPCLAVDVGALAWTGDGFDSPVREDTRAFVSVGPVAQARLVLAGPLALELRGEAVVPLVRDDFTYGKPSDPSTVAYEPGAIGAQLDAALAVGLGALTDHRPQKPVDCIGIPGRCGHTRAVLLFSALASQLGDGAGDGGFRAVFDEHVPYAARFLRRLGIGPGELDDLLQEVFLVVHRRFHEIDETSLRPWIHGICARKASEHRRSARRRREAPAAEGDAPEIADTSAHGRDPERRAAEGQELARLDRVLDTLQDDERVVFVLYEIEQLTLKEIAEATSAPLSTVHARLDRARERVTRAFSRPAARRSA